MKKTSRKAKAITLIVSAVIIEFISAALLRSSSKPYVECLYYTSQIISSIFVISGVVIAVWQYYLSSQSAKHNLEIIQVQRAIDMSEYFKDNILRYYPAIHYIFDRSGALKILESVTIDKFNDFDKQELESIFTKQQIADLHKIQNSDDFYKAVLEANDIYDLNLNILAAEVTVTKQNTKETSIKIDKRSVAVAFTANLINAILNNMEYFALHFRHNTADESVVYQSLHQAYLEIVSLMYYYISRHNVNSSDKLYTNVIWLFEKWHTKKIAQNKERSEKSKAVQSHGTIIEN